MTALFQWANEGGLHGMPKPEELEQIGYRKERQHPFWPTSWLMRKDASDE